MGVTGARGGGSRSFFTFVVVSYGGEWQLPGTFFGMKQISLLAKVTKFLNRENTYNYVAHPSGVDVLFAP